MASILVRRDQFNITPQGIVHKPTDAAFTPRPGEPFSGTTRLGRLGNVPPSEEGYRPDEVKRVMQELWAGYVAQIPNCSKRNISSRAAAARARTQDPLRPDRRPPTLGLTNQTVTGSGGHLGQFGISANVSPGVAG